MRPVVQSLWVGDRLSTMEQLSIRSYMHHGYDYHLYTYAPLDGIPDGTTVKDANDVMPLIADQFSYFAQFADWWRYHLVYQRGGWWVDMDTVCLRPFDDITNEHVIQGYIKAPAGSPVLAWMIEQASAEDWKTMPYGRIGPALYAITVDHFGLSCPSYPDILHCFDSPDWGNYLLDPAPELPADCHAAHLFHQMWVWNSQDVDNAYPYGCLYEQWKRLYA